MNAEHITERIKETLDIVIIPDVMEASELERHATEYEQAATPADAHNDGHRLLSELLAAQSTGNHKSEKI
jgi:hypothetical protein